MAIDDPVKADVISYISKPNSFISCLNKHFQN
jgi:hypothetical protein